MTRDVIIVGGGVIGCSIAWRLAQAGLKVTVFERGRVGCEASRAAAGMLSPQGESQTPGPFFDLCLRSRAMYRSFAEELSDASGIDVEYKDEGTLFVVLRGEDDEEKTGWAKWQVEAGLPLEHVSADDIRKIEPAVTESATRAIFLPEEHQIENRRVMDALEVAMKRAGVELIESAEVTALATERGKVTGVASGGRRLDAGVVVLAAGTWSSRLLEPLGLNVKVTPVRGQMIALRGGAPPINRVLHSTSVYVVPRRDGRILIGATVEQAGFRKAVTARAIKHLLSAAVELVPSLGELEIVETWSGLRPDTIDHLPIIGPGGIDNLLLATGHFRNGILLAPITADLITETLQSGKEPEMLRPFSVDRYAPPSERVLRSTADGAEL
ncbi:MAG TPA: glycine oxidase ThiO [Blastocatellia bacterium]|nr:glycine oxidase ThiO [Blastocatellia bacterium]